MSERPANGTFANSGKNGSRVRSQVALIPPNPKTVVDPWWSETTSPLTWSLAQYAGSTAEGVVPSLQPASVDGGGMPATALAARRTLHTPRARVRFPPLRPARSKRRKNPIPAKIARGTIRYSAWRYGSNTRGATAIPTTAEPRRRRPAGNRARKAHQGWMFTSGRIDSRNVVAYSSQYANVPARRTLANITSRFAPAVHRQGRASPSRTIAPKTMMRKKYRDR